MRRMWTIKEDVDNRGGYGQQRRMWTMRRMWTIEEDVDNRGGCGQ